MQLEFTEEAQENIDDFDDKTKDFVVKKLRHLTDNYNQIVKTKQVERIVSSHSKMSRFKINSDLRAFFITFYEKQDGTIIVLNVTSRQNAYNDKDIKKYERQAVEELNKRKPKGPRR